MNFSEAVLHLPEDLVVRPGAPWRFLEIWWVGALRRNATEVLTCIQNVSLRPGRHMHQMYRRLRTQLIIFANAKGNVYGNAPPNAPGTSECGNEP